MNALQIVAQATSLNYFKTKSDKKRMVIRDELESFFSDSSKEIRDALQAEELRLIEEKAAKDAAKLEKAEKRAAKIAAIAAKEAAKPLETMQEHAEAHISYLSEGSYIVSGVQNNTPINKTLFGILQNFARHNGASFIIAPITYNLHAFQKLEEGEIYYDPLAMPHLCREHVRLGGVIDVLCHANVLPTIKLPLNGFEAATPNHISAIIPASKIALKCLPIPKGAKEKNLYSTGLLTYANYTMRKAGNCALPHHNQGALYVSVKGGAVVVRQLELMQGATCIYDDGLKYTVNSVSECAPDSLMLGDIHAEKLDAASLADCVALIKRLRPNSLQLQDLADWSSRNHHCVKSSKWIFAQDEKGESVQGDLCKIAQVLNTFYDAMPTGGIIDIVASNHNTAIDTWLDTCDYRDDPLNAKIFLSLQLARYENANNGGFNTLRHALESVAGFATHKAIFHAVDGSIIHSGIQFEHGHIGSGGSKGSQGQFMTRRINTGHTHSPAIALGCYTAGVCLNSLDMGYNVGASSWRVGHVTTYPNGQRQVIM